MPHSFTRARLHELIWSEPVRTLAAKLNLSDVGLAKACRRYDIPRPERGYWAKLKAGKKVTRQPLPPRGPGMSDEIIFGGNFHQTRLHVSDDDLLNNVPEPPVFDRPIEDVGADIRKVVRTVTVPRTFDRAHWHVQKLLDADEDRRVKSEADRFSYSWSKPLFEEPIDMRRLRIISAIFTALEKQGYKPSIRDKEAHELYVRVNDQNIHFELDDANARFFERDRYNQRPQKASNKLKLALSKWSSGNDCSLVWEDKPGDKIEAHATEIVCAIILSAEHAYRSQQQRSFEWDTKRRLELIEKRRKQKEEAERLELERLAQEERNRVDRLLDEADALRKARDIRAYVADVEDIYDTDLEATKIEAFERWKAWALAQADRLDPVASRSFLNGIEELKPRS